MGLFFVVVKKGEKKREEKEKGKGSEEINTKSFKKMMD